MENQDMVKQYHFNIFIVYCIAILHCILLIYKCGIQWDYDTASYISAWENISSFHIDIWRTPVYPLFIGITKAFFEANFLMAAAIIQHIVFLISIWYFYKLIAIVTDSERIAFYISAFYALYPCVATWNCFILTEPLAIYSMIFTLYCAIMAYKKHSILYTISLGFWTFFQIFLRPAQIYILPILFVGWLLLFVKEKKVTSVFLGGIFAILIATSAMLVYMWEFKKTYGLYTPCGVSVVNKYYMARRDGNLLIQNIKDKEFRSYVEERDQVFQTGKGTLIDLFTEAQDAVYTFGLKNVSDMLSIYTSTSFSSIIKPAFQRLHNASEDKLFTTFIKKWSIVTDIIGVRINFVFLLLIVYPIAIMYLAIRKRCVPWFSSILFMLGTSHLLIIIVACQNIWGRLILPATPIYLLMFAQLCNIFKISINSDYNQI